jgi:non-ribosomal peptide synthetase component F/acyl carrier protein
MAAPKLHQRLERLSPAQRELVLQKLRPQLQPAIAPAPHDSEVPLSYAQQRLWFLHQLSEGGAAYNISGGVRLTGILDAAILDRAFRDVIARHESLRTTYPGGRVHVGPVPSLPIVESREIQPGDLRRIAIEEANHPFDLAGGPLLRILLLRIAAAEHVLLVTMHHIVSDGWSLALLIRETSALYAAYSSGQPSALTPLKLQYGDFAHWQRQSLQGDVIEKHLSWWRERLAGAPQFLNLPTDHPRPPVQGFEGDVHIAHIPRELAGQLAALGAQNNATFFMTALAAFFVLLSRYSAQEDLLVGSPVANRTRPEVEPLIGLFVNTVVLRANLAGNPPFTELLRSVRQTTLEAFSHQDTPFDFLVEKLQPERSLSHSPVFQAMFVLQNAHSTVTGQPGDLQTGLPGLAIAPLDPPPGTAKFDLTLFLEESQDGVKAIWEYRTGLFEAETIARMARNFQTLLESVVADPSRPVGELDLIAPAERRQLLVEWNETATRYPEDRCFHGLFEDQAARTPTAVAAACGGRSLTYAELNARANRLAHRLRQEGVGRESLVGLYCDRSLDLMAAVLGVLKAGAAYVPLDAGCPPERLRFMLADAQVTLVLTEERLVASLPEAIPRLCLDRAGDNLAGHSHTNPAWPVGADDLAYVLYTSGSTGTPKGAEIPHRGLTNYLSWAVQAYEVASGSGAPIHSSIGFDATITSWFTPLLAGRMVSLVPEGGEIEALHELLQSQEDFSLVKITPAHLEALSHLLPERGAPSGAGRSPVPRCGPLSHLPEYGAPSHAGRSPVPPCGPLNHLLPEQGALRGARAFVIGGEALFGKQLAFWQAHAPGVRMFNEYGPTETVVGCCCYEAPAHIDYGGPVPIGRPIANTQLYVLDANRQPAPLGVPGELYIGGHGVARGYRNRPELTAEKFIPNPFGGGRLYRTGDLVKYLPDGNLVYLGRLDGQVKIRGFRVEPGEVEAVLTRHPAVREAVVVADGRRLAAYVVSACPASELRAFVSSQLPDYMTPSIFVPLAAMPLTANGKVDRRALPPLAPPESASTVAPRTPTETTLATIWAELLGVPGVGVDDNFFELGGHSLLAIQAISRVRQAFGVEIPLRSLFEAPTIASLAARLPASAPVASQPSAIARVRRDQHRLSRPKEQPSDE